jgi:hypothetical protein
VVAPRDQTDLRDRTSALGIPAEVIGRAALLNRAFMTQLRHRAGHVGGSEMSFAFCLHDDKIPKPSNFRCEPVTNFDRPTIIEKYANRRLYNTGTYTFVTLDELAAMVKRGGNFHVYNARTGADITGSVRAQIAFQQENFHGTEQP